MVLPDSKKLKIVLAYKDSRMHLYTKVRPNPKIQELLDRSDISVDQLQKAHEAHLRTLQHIETVLKEKKLKYKKAYRARLAAVDTSNALVITVGGDGTLLEASHRVKGSIILGVNSDPGRSTGSLCIAHQESFAGIFEDFLQGRHTPIHIPRLRLHLNDLQLNVPVLNDVLIAHKNPAATSRFILKTTHKEQDIRASGVWIAGAAGSTGGILSAGGHMVPLDDPRIQIRVREPCASHKNKSFWKNAFLENQESIEVISRMREGMIYLDGPHMKHAFPMGARLRIDNEAAPLSLMVSDEMKSRRLAWAQKP